MTRARAAPGLALLLCSVTAAAAAPRYLALGDSYTIGEAVAPEERWPVQLAALLRARAAAIDDPVIIARTGWTTGELAKGIDAADPKGPFALVSLLIGVNNQYRGRDAEEYRAELRALLARAVAFAGGEPRRVLVLSIPDWGVTPFAEGRDRARIAGEIDRFNAIKREETARAGGRFVDVTPISRRAPAEPKLVAGDGLHPSGAMYAAWAERALPEALAALQNDDAAVARSGQRTLLEDFSSGTSVNPVAAPMHMGHYSRGPWSLMVHGVAFLTATWQTGPRGQDEVYAPNWGMLSAVRRAAAI